MNNLMREDLELLKKYALTPESYEIVLRHSLAVLAKAIEIIGRKELYRELDLELVVSGCLLHDIGAFPFLDGREKQGYIRHGVLGADILRQAGREKEARIAERHTGSGLTKEEILAAGFPLPAEDFLPQSLEEKLICYADKFSSKNPDKHDTLESIIQEFAGYGPGPLARFQALREEFE